MNKFHYVICLQKRCKLVMYILFDETLRQEESLKYDAFTEIWRILVIFVSFVLWAPVLHVWNMSKGPFHKTNKELHW